MARDRLSISRWLALALGMSILLNGVLLALCARLLQHPAVSVPSSARVERNTPSATGTKSEPQQARVVTEGLPRSIRAVLRGHRGYITDLAYTPDGSTLAAATDMGFLSLWDLRDGGFALKTELRAETLGLPADKVFFGPLAFAPNGGSLAYSHNSDETLPKIQVLDIASRRQHLAVGREGQTREDHSW